MKISLLAAIALAGCSLLTTAWGKPDDLILKLGDKVPMRLVQIQAGSFEMGSATTELLDQKPRHRVVIEQPFYLGEVEVTQEQWAAVMQDAPSIHKGETFPDSEKHPVENVSWRYCQLFLAALNKAFPDYHFRLPTEAEWEYACRAGATKEFSFGEHGEKSGEDAWFSDNSGGQTRPVGRKKPNAWGLYDMHGNVWEWCDDSYKPYPGGTLPRDAFAGNSKVLRGGAFNSIPERLSWSYRHNLEPEDCGRYYGFRCTATRKPSP
jgi:formylglycine-generating enzyme required for sulfatase activity